MHLYNTYLICDCVLELCHRSNLTNLIKYTCTPSLVQFVLRNAIFFFFVFHDEIHVLYYFVNPSVENVETACLKMMM